MDSIVPSDIPPGKHYVYSLSYPDGKVFYVGKGKGSRVNHHEAEARTEKTHNAHKVRVIRKIWREGGQVKKTILAYFATHDEAGLYEVALIFFLPDLTNLTRGGDGIVGLPRTAEHQRKIADARRGMKASEETRKKCSDAHKRNPQQSMAHIRKMVEARKGKPSWHKGKKGGIPWNKGVPSPQRGIPRSAETRRKISEANTGKKRSEEARRNISEAQRGKSRPFTEEHKYNLKTSPKAIEQRQRLAEFNRGKKRPPEIYQKIVETKRRNRQAKIDAQTLHKEDWHQGHLWS